MGKTVVAKVRKGRVEKQTHYPQQWIQWFHCLVDTFWKRKGYVRQPPQKSGVEPFRWKNDAFHTLCDNSYSHSGAKYTGLFFLWFHQRCLREILIKILRKFSKFRISTYLIQVCFLGKTLCTPNINAGPNELLEGACIYCLSSLESSQIATATTISSIHVMRYRS